MPLAPSILANAALSFLRDRSVPVRRGDRVCVIIPMYNEERGAATSLASVFAQRRQAQRVVVSINGGSDDTAGVVERALRAEGYVRTTTRDAADTRTTPHAPVRPVRSVVVDSGPPLRPPLDARCAVWLEPNGILAPVVVLTYDRQVGKAESLNAVAAADAGGSDRFVVIDGDTILDPRFLDALDDEYLRLRRRRAPRPGEARWVIEDYGLQSGAVMSYALDVDPGVKRTISRAREAEYAFSCVLRAGQTKQVGRNPITSRTRMYTVVGCGFAARGDVFPIPEATKTEDHDFTLEVQNLDASRDCVPAATLALRGYRVVESGREVPLDAVLDAHEPVEIVRGGNARFAPRAHMFTEDPPHLNGLARQLDRWHGGGVQNFLVRLGRSLRPNVRAALWLAQLESLLGFLFMFALPIAAALHLGNPSVGMDARWLLAWLGTSFLIDTGIVALGFFRFRRAAGVGPVAAGLAAVAATARTIVPFTLMRSANLVAYFAAACSEVSGHLRTRASARRRRRRDAPRPARVVWERPSVRARSLTASMFPLLLSALVVASALAHRVAPLVNPVNLEAWRLTHVPDPVEIVSVPAATLPVVAADRSASAHAAGVPLVELELAARIDVTPHVVVATDASRPAQLVAARTSTRLEATPSPGLLSAYCPPAAVANARSAARILTTPASAGDVAPITGPMGPGQLVLLARYAPIAGYVEEAARAYGVPANHLLRVLINESYLDPLAEGPTQDYGLSQVTGEALTLLRGISTDPRSTFSNPVLLGGPVDVFDPSFSICAGAAKLAWARAQPGVDDDREAYALYINPVRGLPNGSLSGAYVDLTLAMDRLHPIADAMIDVIERFETDPSSLPEVERRLAEIAHDAAHGTISLAEAYRRTYSVVEAHEIPDAAMYPRVLERVYGIRVGPIDAALH